MTRLGRRGPRGVRAQEVPPPPTPSTPVEVGLLLRMVRERSGLTLDEIRDRIGVAKLDIEALEQGRLESLHVEQAAVVALTRYAELLGKDPEPYVEVLRRHWPHRGLALGAVAVSLAGGTPVVHLASASRLLGRIAGRDALVGEGSMLGLSEPTRRALERASGSTARALAALGPAVTQARRPPVAMGGPGGGPPPALSPRGPLPSLPAGGPVAGGPGGTPGPEATGLPVQTASRPASTEAGAVSEDPPPPRPVEAEGEEGVGAARAVAAGLPGGLGTGPETRTPSAGRSVARFLAERFGLDKPTESEAGPTFTTFQVGAAGGSPPSAARAGD